MKILGFVPPKVSSSCHLREFFLAIVAPGMLIIAHLNQHPAFCKAAL